MNTSLSYLLGLGLWLTIAFPGDHAGSTSCLPYEPDTVTIHGTLVLTKKYGPPNYGENPESDERLEIPILRLSHPVDICGDVNGEFNHDAFQNVSEIQLLFRPGTDYRHFSGHKVIAKGVLDQAIMSHHFTQVVMTVRTIKDLKPVEPGS